MRRQLYIEGATNTHVIDNTDARELTEQRLRLVYEDITDQEVEDFLDVFYGTKPGEIVESTTLANGCRPYRAVLE